VTEAFIRSARQHACDHLPLVRDASQPGAALPSPLTHS
jgi:LysR family transcriptional regulator for metE and metH